MFSFQLERWLAAQNPRAGSTSRATRGAGSQSVRMMSFPLLPPARNRAVIPPPSSAPVCGAASRADGECPRCGRRRSSFSRRFETTRILGRGGGALMPLMRWQPARCERKSRADPTLV